MTHYRAAQRRHVLDQGPIAGLPPGRNHSRVIGEANGRDEPRCARLPAAVPFRQNEGESLVARRGRAFRRGLLALTLALFAHAQPAASQWLPVADTPRPWRVVLIRNWDALYAVNVIREGAMR